MSKKERQVSKLKEAIRTKINNVIDQGYNDPDSAIEGLSSSIQSDIEGFIQSCETYPQWDESILEIPLKEAFTLAIAKGYNDPDLNRAINKVAELVQVAFGPFMP